MNKFVGTWRLVSFEERLPDGGVSHPYGEEPAGLLTYDATGHMSVQVMRRDRPRLSSEKITDAGADELRQAVEGFTAFFGAYEVDEERGVVLHRVEGHLLPNSVGKELSRRFEFTGDRLLLKPSETRTVTWERVK
ncbi:MAG TPA: lipocalin-like domain-containing protein [Blastocatellia bacterium]|jgi:hypothetical protein